MDTSKLITVTIWAALVFIAYEALKGVFANGTLTSQLAPGVPASTSVPLLQSGVGQLAAFLGADEQVLANPQDYAGSNAVQNAQQQLFGSSVSNGVINGYGESALGSF